MMVSDIEGPQFIAAGNTVNVGNADAMNCVPPTESRTNVQPVTAQMVAREDTCPLVNVRRTRRRRNESGKTVPKNCGIYFASDGISFTRRLAMKNATVAEVYLGKTGCKSPLDILPFDEDKLPYAMKEA